MQRDIAYLSDMLHEAHIALSFVAGKDFTGRAGGRVSWIQNVPWKRPARLQ